MGLGRCPWTPSPDHCLHWASNLQARPAIKCGYNDKRLDINVGRESECVRVSAAVLMCWLAPAILVTSSALTIRMMIPGRPLDALTSKPKVPPHLQCSCCHPCKTNIFGLLHATKLLQPRKAFPKSMRVTATLSVHLPINHQDRRHTGLQASVGHGPPCTSPDHVSPPSQDALAASRARQSREPENKANAPPSVGGVSSCLGSSTSPLRSHVLTPES